MESRCDGPSAWSPRDAREDRELKFDTDSRLLVFAPHPDDEALATGGLIPHARARGARVHVAFLTDGENNPWPQRVADRRWRIGARERARWGARRRGEALRSLRTLGLAPECVNFLGFPDQRLTALLVDGDPTLPRALRELFDEVRPTHVVGPSTHDHHPDHSALSIVTRAECAARRTTAPRLFEYVVHDRRQQPAGRSVPVRLDAAAIERKRRAIACHTSQLFFRGGELLAFATERETFHVPAKAGSDEPAHPVRRAWFEPSRLAIELSRTPCVRAFGPTELHLVFAGMHGMRRVLRVPLPLRSRLTPILFADGRPYGRLAEYRGGPYHGVLRLPLTPLPLRMHGYVKLESRFGFFDEAGWRSLPLLRRGAVSRTGVLVPGAGRERR